MDEVLRRWLWFEEDEVMMMVMMSLGGAAIVGAVCWLAARRAVSGADEVVREEVGDEVREEVGDEVLMELMSGEVGDEVKEEVGDEVLMELMSGEVGDEVREEVGDEVLMELMSGEVGDEVRENVDEVRERIEAREAAVEVKINEVRDQDEVNYEVSKKVDEVRAFDELREVMRKEVVKEMDVDDEREFNEWVRELVVSNEVDDAVKVDEVREVAADEVRKVKEVASEVKLEADEVEHEEGGVDEVDVREETEADRTHTSNDVCERSRDEVAHVLAGNEAAADEEKGPEAEADGQSDGHNRTQDGGEALGDRGEASQATIDDEDEERRVMRSQLDAVWRIMRASPHTFGDVSPSELREQLKLYAP